MERQRQAGEPYGTQSGLSVLEKTVQRPTIIHSWSSCSSGLSKPWERSQQIRYTGRFVVYGWKTGDTIGRKARESRQSNRDPAAVTERSNEFFLSE
jgi:hypothetical protein